MSTTPTEITIPAEEHTRMGWYNSIYSSQYLLSKHSYESRRKKWLITCTTINWFLLKDSNDIVTKVYYSSYIKNCECDDFIREETGYCQHIYAIENNRYQLQKFIGRDKPIIYVNYPQLTLNLLDRKTTVLSITDIDRLKTQHPNAEITPSVTKFITRQSAQQTSPFVVDLGDFSLFNDAGINLYQHQKESITQMLSSKRSILTLKMGLGKTICALYCCKVLQETKRIIIVCPNSLKFQWQKEINRFQLGSSLVISKGTDIAKYQEHRFLILSYEMLNRHSLLLIHQYDVAIIDEIQKIKNDESKTWETIRCLHAKFIFSLSGTPIQNSITDLISILKVISPKEFSPDWKFYETYCNLSKTRLTGWNPNNLPKLQQKLKQYVINPKINLNDFKLPTKMAFTIECSMDALQKQTHNSALEAARLLLSKSYHYPLTFQEKAKLNGLLLCCRRAVSDGRLVNADATKSDRFEKIEELLVTKIRAGKKVVVYSDWIDCLKLLMPRLIQENIQYTIFTGELSDKVKSQHLDLFISDPDVKVFLSTDSGGLGVDGLQLASDTIIHVEDIWNPMKLSQREGRLIRALQSSLTVDIYYFDSKSGIEEMLKVNKAGKHQIIKEVMS